MPFGHKRGCPRRKNGGTVIPKTVKGRVKWFNVSKGFGFVVADQPGPDILIHVNALRSFGQDSVAEGTVVELVAQETNRGWQATEILAVEANGAASLDEGDLSKRTAIGRSSTTLYPARVKWFDKIRGFGFANIYGESGDVFLHMEVLRESGLADLQSGEAIAVRVKDGQRGKMATEICPWETT